MVNMVYKAEDLGKEEGGKSTFYTIEVIDIHFLDLDFIQSFDCSIRPISLFDLHSAPLPLDCQMEEAEAQSSKSQSLLALFSRLLSSFLRAR